MCARCAGKRGHDARPAPDAWPRAGCAWLCCAIGVAGVACYLFPVYWMFISGLKTSAEIFANPPSLLPTHPTLAAFEYVFAGENVARYMRNSLAIAIPVTVVTLRARRERQLCA